MNGVERYNVLSIWKTEGHWLNWTFIRTLKQPQLKLPISLLYRIKSAVQVCHKQYLLYSQIAANCYWSIMGDETLLTSLNFPFH